MDQIKIINKTINTESIIYKVKQHCLRLLTHSRCKVLPFHSVQHTLEVFKDVQVLGKFESINNEEMELLKIAALFHDTGVSATYKGHEDISAKKAQIFLRSSNYPENKIVQIMNCIYATSMPQQPHTQLERIICDADLFHLSSKHYAIKNQLLRTEWEVYLNLIFTNKEWNTLNVNFLREHRYHTEYGKTILQFKKMKNVERMQNA